MKIKNFKAGHNPTTLAEAFIIRLERKHQLTTAMLDSYYRDNGNPINPAKQLVEIFNSVENIQEAVFVAYFLGHFHTHLENTGELEVHGPTKKGENIN